MIHVTETQMTEKNRSTNYRNTKYRKQKYNMQKCRNTEIHIRDIQITRIQKYKLKFHPVMSEYNKMDMNEYPNIFGYHIMYRMNIQIYSDAKYLQKEYPNIFVFQK